MGIPTPHTATPVGWLLAGEKIEGEREAERIEFTPFGCFLQLPASQDRPGPRPAQVKRPTLLCRVRDVIGDPIELKRGDELSIVALSVTGADPVLWQIVGTPEVLAAPRRRIGSVFHLSRVED